MIDDTLHIQTASGFAGLRIYPTSLKTEGKVTTAEVIEDWTEPHLILLKANGGEAMFRIQGREARCIVTLSEPFFEVRKVMFRALTLVEAPEQRRSC